MKKLAIVTLLGALLTACGGNKEEVKPPIMMQTAADEVLRIGDVWTSVVPEKGILSPPSEISVFKNHVSSELTLTKKTGREVLVITEELQLRNGTAINCSTRFEHAVEIRWGRRQGEAAVEVIRPQVTGQRKCDGVHPEGPIAHSRKRALFVLRSDSLIAVEPRLDKRTYISRPM